VRDFARLIERVLDASPDVVSFEVFNGGGDANNLTKRQILEMVLEHVPQGRVIFRDNSPDPRNYRVDFRKVRERLRFEPQFDVAYGIAEIIAALRSHLLDDVDARPTFYGNYELPGLTNSSRTINAGDRVVIASATQKSGFASAASVFQAASPVSDASNYS
jgi:hypothetical protein